MKKKLMLFLALVLVVGCTLLMACGGGGDDPDDTTAPATSAPATSAPATSAPASVLGSVTFADATVTYDGTAKTIAVSGAPAGATVTYSVNGGAAASAVSVTDAGTYTVVATVTAGTESVQKTATLTVNKAAYTLPADTVYFPATATVTYDGQYHMPEAAVALPAGVIATPDGTPVLNAGDEQTYTINFAFSDPAMANNFVPPAPLTGITLTVAKADIDMSGVVFEADTVPYDGQYHTLTISGVPEMLNCVPRGGGIARGTYDVTATFTFKNSADAANYNLPAPMTAQLTIGAGAITLPEFTDKELPYNGSNRVPAVPAIEGIASTTVTITQNGEPVDEAKLPGEYMVTITFTVADTEAYLPVDPVSYKLTVTKAVITGLEPPVWGPLNDTWDVETVNGGYFLYADGVAHEVEVNLPAAFLGYTTEIVYTHRRGGQIVTDTTAPGLYTTTATITLVSDTYILPEDYDLGSFTWLVSDKTVDAGAIVFDIADKTYDGTALDFSWSIDGVAGLLGSSYVLFDADGNEIDKADATAVGTYKIVITFETDAANGYAPLTVEKTVNISTSEIDISGVAIAWDHPMTYGAPFFYYDGQTKTVALTADTVTALEALGVSVAGYENNVKSETGDYVAVVTLACDANHTISQTTFEFAWGIALPDDDAWSDETVK